MALPLSPATRKKLLPPDPNDPTEEPIDPEDEELEKKGGKQNPLKRWAAAQLGTAEK